MKNYTLIYRIFSAALIFLVFAGATLPSGLHEKDAMMEMCKTMESHPMSQEECDFGLACACSIEQAPVKTEAKASVAPLKIKAVFAGLLVFEKQPDHTLYTNFNPISSQLAEASPPIYLKNSAFLN
ncbi:MAG: hypothetical protein U5J95_03065 [Balneolaceae bacterium]|nr:hypothetical protein [Balneolaceae bacterium]